VELAPNAFIFVVVERESVLTEEMHIAEGGRYAAITHDDGNLMEAFRQQGPVIPVVLGGTATRSGIALDSTIEVGEVVYITNKEGGSVVADQVPVALFGVKLYCSTSNVTFAVSSASLARNG